MKQILRNFSRNLSANVNVQGGCDKAVCYIGLAYYDENGQNVGGSMSFDFLATMFQDRETRRHDNSFDCEWAYCAGVLDKAKYYTITIDADLVDMP